MAKPSDKQRRCNLEACTAGAHSLLHERHPIEVDPAVVAQARQAIERTLALA